MQTDWNLTYDASTVEKLPPETQLIVMRCGELVSILAIDFECVTDELMHVGG